ncbi:MAG: mandelate racemase/muconate lactonizing enzyme family protein, partial [Leadbetterella sp.]
MKRKDFLRNSLLTTLGLGSASIDSIAQFKGQQKLPDNAIKITDIKTYLHARALFVKIETNTGISGWGEADHDNTKVLITTIHEVFKPLILGQNPFESEYIWHQCMYKGEDLGLSGVSTGAISGIDNAIWDFKGKYLKKPVYE